MTRSDIEKEFSKGDLRGTGGMEKVLAAYEKDNSLSKEIFDLVFSGDRLMAMRAIDAFEKISSKRGVTDGESKRLLDIISTPKHKEFMWHYVQILGYMDIPENMREEVFNYLETALCTYLDSNIVRTFAMQTMFDKYMEDSKYGQRVLNTIYEMSQSDIPSLKSRANKLLKIYNKRYGS